jgi:hypothetical protein
VGLFRHSANVPWLLWCVTSRTVFRKRWSVIEGGATSRQPGFGCINYNPEVGRRIFYL